MHHPDNVMWLDIETIPTYHSKQQYNASQTKQIREKKYCKDKPRYVSWRQWYTKKAALFHEFGTIVCVVMQRGDKVKKRDIESYETEYAMLNNISYTFATSKDITRWWHNIISYDLPFLVKKMISYGINPYALNQSGKKPWEMSVVDTMKVRQMWAYVSSSLEVMCHALGVPSPKQSWAGSDVLSTYLQWNVQHIVEYCARDVKATYECYKHIYSVLHDDWSSNTVTTGTDEPKPSAKSTTPNTSSNA